ncbi:pentapeptide repeat-containing protein [Wukongibacter baidiensis]|uniref:pentapeptide repeat-containing protein n=1 Tax=Wukongibacter baidiensis TaxID=1723361 RepID=UPI003D7F90D4
MEDNIISKFELHKKWVETIGKEGEMLRLDEVDLRSFDLSDKLFEQAYLADCTFDNLKLENIDFHASVLCSSTFRNTNLNKCDFYKSDLSYTDFSNAFIKNVRFSKGDCWEAIFKNADLIDCNLINVYFYLTDFSNARLDNVDISVTTFEETLLNGVTLKNIKGIEEAHFESINIGTLEKPILLKSEEAREWIIANCS